MGNFFGTTHWFPAKNYKSKNGAKTVAFYQQHPTYAAESLSRKTFPSGQEMGVFCEFFPHQIIDYQRKHGRLFFPGSAFGRKALRKWDCRPVKKELRLLKFMVSRTPKSPAEAWIYSELELIALFRPERAFLAFLPTALIFWFFCIKTKEPSRGERYDNMQDLLTSVLTGQPINLST
ncbi:MAG: hypothetical protein JSS82_01520 [Bacteroidetes bacterium]|nr:hypothetical protein [Bacteroidota bacterium]